MAELEENLMAELKPSLPKSRKPIKGGIAIGKEENDYKEQIRSSLEPRSREGRTLEVFWK